MRHAAFLSRFGRGACGSLAACGLAIALAGCSTGSRFDFPVFNLTESASTDANADPNSTASLPVPPESVYASGESQSEGRIARATLPPPAYTPRPSADYTPAPSSRIRQAAYTGRGKPEAEPLVTRGAPKGRHVKIAKGDTLSVLSRRYDVPVEDIMNANNLPDGRLRIGQDLIIPGAGGNAVEAEAAPRSAPESSYKVAKGDTPHSIADKLGVDERALLARNKLKANKLKIGQVLIVPGKSKSAIAAKEPRPAKPEDAPDVHVVRTTTIPAPGTSLAEEEAQSADPAADAKSRKKTASKAEPAASPETTGPTAPRVASNEQLPAPDPMSGNSFRWPVKGRIISEFGARPDGGHNDGIDVAVPQGTSVMAAENGVVAYAGNELKGYGNLILIRHSNNWVSAYAHNDAILVKRGDKVRRGQVIAKAGASGSVAQPQLHFELRKGSRPVDPKKFMSNQSASAD